MANNKAKKASKPKVVVQVCPTPPKPKKAKRSRPRGSTEKAAVAVGLRSTRNLSRKAHVEDGYEEILHLDNVGNLPRGSIVFNFELNGFCSPRMSNFARNFQKVVYEDVSFEVITEASTACTGSYIAAFVRDASDNIPPGSVIDYLSNTKGNILKKWWESNKFVRASDISRVEYYTSPGEDPRIYSPGRFVLAVNTPPDQRAPLTVKFHWKVKFLDPSQESIDAPVTSGSLESNCGLWTHDFLMKNETDRLQLADTSFTLQQVTERLIDSGRWTLGLNSDGPGMIRYYEYDAIEDCFRPIVKLPDGEVDRLLGINNGFGALPCCYAGDTWYPVSQAEVLQVSVVDFSSRARRQERLLASRHM